MVNDLVFNQMSTVLNAITKQVTGAEPIAIVDTASFISVGQTVLKQGYDPLNTAISQIYSHTIFSTRKYIGKMKGLKVDSRKFGAIARKLAMVDSEWDDESSYELVNDQSVDMYKVKKPSVLQLNFYGANVFKRFYTVYLNQLDCALDGPEQLANFTAMYMTNVSDMIEQCEETTARMIIANFIGGKIAANNGVVHLVSEYNDYAGTDLDTDTVRQPQNWEGFAKFAAARIKDISNLMTERTRLFQIQVDGKPLTRHTPKNKQKFYMFSPYMNYTLTSVYSSVFGPDYLKTIDYEEINFWQSVESPDGISVKPIYLDTNGSLKTTEEAITQANIYGVIFDEEALGYTIVNEWAATTPLNADGGYYNHYYHYTHRYWNDFTEKGVVLLLD